MSENKKFKWFKFYFIYRDLIYECPVLQLKKLMIAIIDYAEFGLTPEGLNRKAMTLYNEVKQIIDKDREYSVKNGTKGANQRWNKDENRVAIKKNRVAITEK